MPRHLTRISRPLALACSVALIGAGLALGSASATAAPGVTPAVTSDGICDAMPMPLPVWTMTISPSGPLAFDQTYTVTVDSSVDYSVCPAIAPTVTFTAQDPLFPGISPTFDPASCQVVGHSCSVTLHSDNWGGTYTVRAQVNGQDIVSPQQVVWSGNAGTPVSWFTQLLAFFRLLVDWFPALISVLLLLATT